MFINPKTHHNQRLMDCTLTIYPHQDSPGSAELNREAVITAIVNPACFESLPAVQRELLITRARELNMLDEAEKLLTIDRFARKDAAHRQHPVDPEPALCISCVVPRLSIAAIVGALALFSGAFVFALFATH